MFMLKLAIGQAGSEGQTRETNETSITLSFRNSTEVMVGMSRVVSAMRIEYEIFRVRQSIGCEIFSGG